MESGDLIKMQYDALRSEILQLMEANETRVFGAAGFASAAWGTLIALVAADVQVPGMTFLSPALLLILGLSMHVVYSKRIANISAYLGHLLETVSPSGPNWELDIAEFARSSGIDVSARVSVVAIYSVSVWVGSIGAVVVPVIRSLNPGKSTPSNLLDLVGTLLLGSIMLASLLKVAGDYKRFSARRSDFDSYWKKHFSAASPGH